MGISKNRYLRHPDKRKPNLELLDTPCCLIRYAESNNIKTCPLDAQRLAEALGIKVVYDRHLISTVTSRLQKDEDDLWIIRINAFHKPERQRYAITHALGHYCLHRDADSVFEDQIFFRNKERSSIEAEANLFAVELLMPEVTFEGFLKQGIRRIEELAKSFGISPVALQVRAKQLGYIN